MQILLFQLVVHVSSRCFIILLGLFRVLLLKFQTPAIDFRLFQSIDLIGLKYLHMYIQYLLKGFKTEHITEISQFRVDQLAFQFQTVICVIPFDQ